MVTDEIVRILNNLSENKNRIYAQKARNGEIEDYYGVYKDVVGDGIEFSLEEEFKMIMNAIDAYKILQKNDRELIKLYLNNETRNYVYGLVRVAANMCLNEASQEIFTNALYMIEIKFPDIDFRDDFSEMVMICDVALRKTLSYDEYLLSGDLFAEKIKKYLASPDRRRVIGFMQNVIKTDEKGKQYYLMPPWETSVQYLLKTWVDFHK